jgi:hypothetical protein
MTTEAAEGATEAPRAPLPQLVLELKELVVTYVKQETVVPLQQLGRYVGFGIGGALLIGLGSVLLGVGALRALQTETGDTFQGDWSWAPYGITFLLLIVGGMVTWAARRSRVERKERKQKAKEA